METTVVFDSSKCRARGPEADAELGSGAREPRREEFAGEERWDVGEGSASECGSSHANAGVAQVIGRHDSMFSSLMHSAPDAIA